MINILAKIKNDYNSIFEFYSSNYHDYIKIIIIYNEKNKLIDFLFYHIKIFNINNKLILII